MLKRIQDRCGKVATLRAYLPVLNKLSLTHLCWLWCRTCFCPSACYQLHLLKEENKTGLWDVVSFPCITCRSVNKSLTKNLIKNLVKPRNKRHITTIQSNVLIIYPHLLTRHNKRHYRLEVDWCQCWSVKEILKKLLNVYYYFNTFVFHFLQFRLLVCIFFLIHFRISKHIVACSF